MLYVMRHGRTDWNELHKIQGRTDIPLNEEGRRMALEAREKHKDVHFDICFCSPLVRAKETADIFLEGREIPVKYDDRLIEMSFGEYEGKVYDVYVPDCPLNHFFKDPVNYNPNGKAETFDELFARTKEFLDEVAIPLVNDGKDVLIVGHGAMNSSIVTQLKGWGLEHFWDAGIKNCELMRLI